MGRPRQFLFGLACVSSLFPSLLPAEETIVEVGSREEMIQAVNEAKPGTRIRIAHGTYAGDLHFRGISGTAEAPIVIEGPQEEGQLAMIASELGGNTGIHLSACHHLHLQHLSVRGFPRNGINIDDGGGDSGNGLAKGIRLLDVFIGETGPHGNHDGLKLSGLSNFEIIDCDFLGWGGSGIDMVGCHEGVIRRCRFEGKPGFSQANGIQMKGGSSRIAVTKSLFLRTGQRGINLGGGTGLPYFRPIDAKWEARDIEVAGNVFFGGLAPIAWVGIDGGHVHHNTILFPEKWVTRILQENTDPRFGLCRNGRFEHNLVVFDRRVRTFVNIGPKTKPDTFTFRGNAWFDRDNPKRGPSGLPNAEAGGIVGVDPEIKFDPERGTYERRSAAPELNGIGASAFRPDSADSR